MKLKVIGSSVSEPIEDRGVRITSQLLLSGLYYLASVTLKTVLLSRSKHQCNWSYTHFSEWDLNLHLLAWEMSVLTRMQLLASVDNGGRRVHRYYQLVSVTLTPLKLTIPYGSRHQYVSYSHFSERDLNHCHGRWMHQQGL